MGTDLCQHSLLADILRGFQVVETEAVLAHELAVERLNIALDRKRLKLCQLVALTGL